MSGHGAGRFDFNRGHGASGGLDDKVDFLVVTRAEVGELDLLLRPACLLHQFVHSECLNEVAELGQGRGRPTRQFLRGEADEMGGESRVDDVGLRAADRAVRG